MTEYKIPEPPNEIFLYRNDQVFDIMNEGATTYMLDRIEYTDGIKVYIKDIPYPKKGFVTPEAIWSCNILKRVLMLASPLQKPSKFIKGFNELGYKVMKHHLLKLCSMTPVAKELHILIKTFMVHLGFDKQMSYEFAMFFSHLIEYDDAYRYRFQDVMSEITKEQLLEYPRRTIDNIMSLLYARDSAGVANKFNKIAVMFYWLLLIPKVRIAWNKTIEIMNIEALQYDKDDRYWVSVRDDYKYMGKTYKERFDVLDIKPQGYKMKYE
jgi:hypothetical protein